jgi:hypothetical protein
MNGTPVSLGSTQRSVPDFGFYDMRTRGRPHPAYLIGGAIVLAVQVLRVPLSTTPLWYAIADFLARFGG